MYKLKKDVYFKGRRVVDYSINTDLFGFTCQYTLSLKTDDDTWFDVFETTDSNYFRLQIEKFLDFSR